MENRVVRVCLGIKLPLSRLKCDVGGGLLGGFLINFLLT